MFKNKEIEIAVCEAGQSEEDETTYLLKSPANRERLLKAIENVAHERNLVTVKLDGLPWEKLFLKRGHSQIIVIVHFVP